MKKVWAVLLMVVLMFSVAGCGDKGGKEPIENSTDEIDELNDDALDEKKEHANTIIIQNKEFLISAEDFRNRYNNSGGRTEIGEYDDGSKNSLGTTYLGSFGFNIISVVENESKTGLKFVSIINTNNDVPALFESDCSEIINFLQPQTDEAFKENILKKIRECLDEDGKKVHTLILDNITYLIQKRDYGEQQLWEFNIIPTDNKALNNSEWLVSSLAGAEYEFTAGNYVVGEDIPMGKYDVQWISGLGNCITGDMIETFGDNELAIKEYKNVDLIPENKITVDGTVKIKFIAK